MSLLLGLLGTTVEKSILHSLSNVEHCLGFVDSFYPFFFFFERTVPGNLSYKHRFKWLSLPSIVCVFFLVFFHYNSAISLELQRNCNKEVSRFI